jgi:hypothetical protein
MNARIDQAGALHLNRLGSDKSAEKVQSCPHVGNKPCGDWCPLFDVSTEKRGKAFDIMIGCGTGKLITAETLRDQRPGGADS